MSLARSPREPFAFRFETRTPDPMWGAIPLTGLEAALLEHPQVTRLGHIKQMGLAFLDFPTLTHTRLEHSIGVLHVADMIYTTLWESDRLDASAREAVFGDAGRNAQYRQAVRLAALLHDLGHPPFSHAVELTFTRYPSLLREATEAVVRGSREAKLFEEYSHETFTCWLIEKLFGDPEAGGLVSVLAPDVVEEIPRLAVGRARGPLAPFNPIISGDFDADRIDYLIRDNRRSGFAIGLSLDELYNAVHLRWAGDGYELYIDASALPFVNSVLSARQRLIRRVHLAPTGRTATQMLINCLFGILRPYPPEELKKTIVWLHERCTDYTFYQKLRENQKARRGGEARAGGCPVEAYFVDRFETVAHRPGKQNTWREHTSLDFMHMHPCLRLLAHIAGSGDWDSPRELTFRHEGRPVFLEPSAKSAQWSDLMVDYDQEPGPPVRRPGDGHDAGAARRAAQSLDFVGATENRIGRAILVQAMSNLDFFVYEMDPVGPGGAGSLPASEDLPPLGGAGAEDVYYRNLAQPAMRAAAITLAEIGRSQRNRWNVERWGMIATEYVLLVLYALDQHVRKCWKDARDVYVYRSEFFVNSFLPSLAPGSPDVPEAVGRCYPDLFKVAPGSSPPINQKRVFSQIQRLAAFGLILTRSSSAFHERRDGVSGATRANIHTTREEIQVNMWGRYYVENELLQVPEFRTLADLVSRRQERWEAPLQEMADLYAKIESPRAGQLVSPGEVADAERLRHEAASTIRKGGGCAMTFTAS